MRGSPHSLHSSSTIWPLCVDVGRERKDEACASFANNDKIGFLPKRPLRNRPGPRQSQHRHPPKPGARTTTGLVRRVYEEDPCHIQRHCAALRSFTEADLQLLCSKLGRGDWQAKVSRQANTRQGRPRVLNQNELNRPASASKTACDQCVFWQPPALPSFAVSRYAKWNLKGSEDWRVWGRHKHTTVTIAAWGLSYTRDSGHTP